MNLPTPLDITAVENIIAGRHKDPFEVLGPIIDSEEELGFDPRTNPHHLTLVWIYNESETVSMKMKPTQRPGLFEVRCSTSLFETGSGKYKFKYTDQDNNTMSIRDPYAFEPLLTDMDLHLFNEGTHLEIYERLGAHRRTIDGVTGINFAVWAPNAQGICVTGDFNDWDKTSHPMKKRVPSGIWELFVPELGENEIYKFSRFDRQRHRRLSVVRHRLDGQPPAAQRPRWSHLGLRTAPG